MIVLVSGDKMRKIVVILVLALSMTVTHCWTGLDDDIEEDGADESLVDDDDEEGDDGDDDLDHEGNGNGYIDPSQFVG